MRFKEIGDHLLQFEAVRGACSREWQITGSLVMCTELDLSNYCGLPVSPTATMQERSASFLVISFFRFSPMGRPQVWADRGDHVEMFIEIERGRVAGYRRMIQQWVAGDLVSLSPSTSTRVAQRLRAGHPDN